MLKRWRDLRPLACSLLLSMFPHRTSTSPQRNLICCILERYWHGSRIENQPLGPTRRTFQTATRVSTRNSQHQFTASIHSIVTIGYVAARTFFRKYNLISIRNLFPEVYNKSARFTYKDKSHCFRRRLNSDGSTDRSVCNCFFTSSIPAHIGIRLISWWQI